MELSGVLYQLLTTLNSGLNAIVEEVARGQDVASVRIVVEPDRGGDTQIRRPALRRVDQIKIRRGAFAWTTRTIVEDVLPDLFKAASDKNTPSQYRFVVALDLEIAIANSSVISYLQVGRPETILIDVPERVRKQMDALDEATAD